VKRLFALSLLLAACSHSEPFTAPDEPLDGPHSPGVPLRLTYADGGPSAPTWTADGDSVLYSYMRRGGGFAVNEEGCLAILPAGGGSIRREICSRSVFPVQSADVFDLPALSPGGMLAFYHDGQPSAPGTGAEALLVAPFATPSAYSVIRTFPFQGDVFYVALASPSWLDDARLVGIGIAEEQIPPVCENCQPTLIRYGHAILLADVTAPGTMTPLAGTELATSVTRGETSDVIYYTLGNDSRIYRRALSTGETVVAHDFGSPAIARDVHFAAGLLVAVVGGSVLLHEDELGTRQSVSLGGNLHVVAPGSGDARSVTTPQPMWFRQPALSPDGSAIVAEGAPLQITPIGDGAGTIIGYDTLPGPTSIWSLPSP
jgi:hypothetical protein